MNGEESRNTGGLSPEYQSYKRQKCFIAYSEGADWSADLLSACEEVLSRPEFNLEPSYAADNPSTGLLLDKVVDLIANARYGIYDLSSWRDEKEAWRMSGNVFIELGVAIALNRPTLLLRHASNRELALPECLQSVGGNILEFSGEMTLISALKGRLPGWTDKPPERDWWNRYCLFGGRTCEFREAHPRLKQWGEQTLPCHISDSRDVDRDDFRSVIKKVLNRYRAVEYTYLDELPVAKGYDFLLCSHCQMVRSTPFAIYRITLGTSAETFIAIGMSIALEKQFKYEIPKILLTENLGYIPSLLSGYEVVVARNDRERRKRLRAFIPAVVQRARQTMWTSRPLPFIEDVPAIDDLKAYGQLQERIHRAIEQARTHVQNAEFDKARRVIRAFPDVPDDDVKNLKTQYLAQIDEAEDHFRINRAVEEAQGHVQNAEFDKARRVIRTLPNKPEDVRKLKEQYLAQIDDAKRKFNADFRDVKTRLRQQGIEDSTIRQIAASNSIDTENPRELYGLLLAIEKQLPPNRD